MGKVTPHPFLGKKRPEFAKKISKILKGRKRSPETVAKMRLGNLGKKYFKEVNLKKGSPGHRNTKWKGGAIKWQKKQAKIRDDYTCQICGLRDIEIIEVDHIKMKCEFPELNSSLENLITLCPNCHRRKTNRDLKRINSGKSNEERRKQKYV